MSAKQKSFRIRLKSERTRIGFTQAQTAELLSIPFRTFCDWEYGITTPAEVAQEGAMARLAATPSVK